MVTLVSPQHPGIAHAGRTAVTSSLVPRHSRYDYSPLIERKDYSWPGGKRLAFCITTNVEVFAFGKGRGHDNAKLGEPQTHRNYSWRDYGNRIGIWRLFDLAAELQLPLAHNANSLLYEHAPRSSAIRARGTRSSSHQLGDSTIWWERTRRAIGSPQPWNEGTAARMDGAGSENRGRILKGAGMIYHGGRTTTSRSGCARARARCSPCRTRPN
jgi:hypothetical protein